jgi:hypothetical protein
LPAGVAVDVDGVLDDAGVGGPAGGACHGDPAQHSSAGAVEGDQAVRGQLLGVEGLPGGRGRLEGGVAFVDAGLVDGEDLIGVLSQHRCDPRRGRRHGR